MFQALEAGGVMLNGDFNSTSVSSTVDAWNSSAERGCCETFDYVVIGSVFLVRVYLLQIFHAFSAWLDVSQPSQSLNASNQEKRSALLYASFRSCFFPFSRRVYRIRLSRCTGYRWLESFLSEAFPQITKSRDPAPNGQAFGCGFLFEALCWCFRAVRH